MFKKTDKESILKKALELFSQSKNSTDLFTASILASVLAFRNSGTLGYENIKRTADFTASVSRESIIKIKKELI